MPVHNIDIVEVAGQMEISRIVQLAAVALYIYDWILTIPDEINLMWTGGSFSSIKAIYFFNRYTSIPFLLVGLYRNSPYVQGLTQANCQLWLVIESSWMILSYASAHWLVGMRVHALYGRKRPIFICICCIFAMYAAATIGIDAAGQYFTAWLPVDPHLNVCVADVLSWQWTIWVPTLIFEFVIFLLTIRRALTQGTDMDKQSGTLLQILYRDGLVFFVLITSASFFNLVVFAFAPIGFFALSRYISFVIVNISSAHLIYNIRRVFFNGNKGQSRISSDPSHHKASPVYRGNSYEMGSPNPR